MTSTNPLKYWASDYNSIGRQFWQVLHKHLKRMCIPSWTFNFLSISFRLILLAVFFRISIFIRIFACSFHPLLREVCWSVLWICLVRSFFILSIVALVTLKLNYWVHMDLELPKLPVNCLLYPHDVTPFVQRNATRLRASFRLIITWFPQLSFDSC